MKILVRTAYIIGLLVLTVFFMYETGKLTFWEIVEEYESRPDHNKPEMTVKDIWKKAEAKPTFKQAILEPMEREKLYLGYRVLEQRRLEDHFHHIDFDLEPDQRLYCIKCHGDMPHDKIKELRAFQNMHASFIACPTCHVRLERSDEENVFKWYDKKTGEIVANPVREGVPPGTYRAKIVPFERVNGKLQRIDSQERIDFAREYREAENTLSDLQKEKAKKIIHDIVSKKPYMCEDCHQSKTPALPFRKLGYSKRRINTFRSTEVVGMIKNYTQFYMPRILHPGFANED
jgi:hypothetical protein